jgi:hypothetical protein
MSAASEVVGIDRTANAAVKRILLKYADMALPRFINAGERPAHMSRSRVDADIFAGGGGGKKRCPLKAGNQRGTEVRSLASETDIFSISSACRIISAASCRQDSCEGKVFEAASPGKIRCAEKWHFPEDSIFREIWSGRRDLNPRPQPWQGCALPLSYTRSNPPVRGSSLNRGPPSGDGRYIAQSILECNREMTKTRKFL